MRKIPALSDLWVSLSRFVSSNSPIHFFLVQINLPSTIDRNLFQIWYIIKKIQTVSKLWISLSELWAMIIQLFYNFWFNSLRPQNFNLPKLNTPRYITPNEELWKRESSTTHRFPQIHSQCAPSPPTAHQIWKFRNITIDNAGYTLVWGTLNTAFCFVP